MIALVDLPNLLSEQFVGDTAISEAKSAVSV
jgi:hypothetical protein